MILIPVAITVFCLYELFKPMEPGSDQIWFLPVFLRLLLLVPIGASWLVYYAFALMFVLSGKGFWF